MATDRKAGEKANASKSQGQKAAQEKPAEKMKGSAASETKKSSDTGRKGGSR